MFAIGLKSKVAPYEPFFDPRFIRFKAQIDDVPIPANQCTEEQLDSFYPPETQTQELFSELHFGGATVKDFLYCLDFSASDSYMMKGYPNLIIELVKCLEYQPENSELLV